jgi:glycosyltransferase involved in cell wall biosynthesis
MKISVITPTIRGREALEPNKESLAAMTFPPDEFEWLIEESDGTKHDLNAAFNRMLRKAKGELIVFMEDYTKATTNGLIKFWEAYQKEPNVFWTAPLGKTEDWKIINWDWRGYSDATETTYNCWEIDWGAAPKKALVEIGGFDEELDKYWSGDNVNVAYRAYLNGYKFKNLFDNPAVAYNHDAVMEHPFRKNFNPAFQKERLDSFKPGEKLTYL